MIRLLPGVSLYKFTPQALLAMRVAESEFDALPSGPELEITSCNDRVHLKTSYHYEGNAWDGKTRGLPAGVDKTALSRRIAGRLGEEYDVILEDLGTPNEHLHCEWDRRRVEAARLAAGLEL